MEVYYIFTADVKINKIIARRYSCLQKGIKDFKRSFIPFFIDFIAESHERVTASLPNYVLNHKMGNSTLEKVFWPLFKISILPKNIKLFGQKSFTYGEGFRMRFLLAFIAIWLRLKKRKKSAIGLVEYFFLDNLSNNRFSGFWLCVIGLMSIDSLKASQIVNSHL
jgi:hypothetical protein